MARRAAHTLLPAVHNAVHAAIVPVPAHMLGIRKAGAAEARNTEGHRTRRVAHTEVQPVGRLGIRPSSIAAWRLWNWEF